MPNMYDHALPLLRVLLGKKTGLLLLLLCLVFQAQAQTPSIMSVYGSPCVGSRQVFSLSTCSATSWGVTGNGSIVSQSSSSVEVKWNSASTSSYVYAYYNCSYSSGTAYSSTFTVSNSVTPSVSISADKTAICGNEKDYVEFTAKHTNGGSPSYQWYKNGVAISGATAYKYRTNSTVITSSSDAITCVISSSLTCVTSRTATSNKLYISVATPTRVDVTIESRKIICSDGKGEFEAKATGGTGYTYVWYVNNVERTSDYTSAPASFFATTLNEGEAVTCKVTATGGCYSNNPATSNTIIVKKTSVTPVVSIKPTSGFMLETGGPTACSGSTVSFKATPGGTGVTAKGYSWVVNGVQVSTDSTCTVSNYTGQSVYVTMTASGTCLTSTTATSSLALAIKPNVGIPSAIAGRALRSQGSGSDDYSSSATDALSYAWSLSPAEAGTIAPAVDPRESKVTWNPSFAGVAVIKVTASGCGPSTSTNKEVTVTLAAPEAVANVTMATLPDTSITASSCWSGCESGGHEARRGRLFDASGTSNWSAQTNDANQFLLVDLGSVKTVDAIATQGRHGSKYPQWVTSYKVAYSPNKFNWVEYPQVFTGNSDPHGVVTNTIASPFQARYVKIIPVSFNEHITMRAEIISVPHATSQVTFLASQPPGSSTNRWYAAPSGGTPLHTGKTFTASLSQNTTYYVSSYDAGTGMESPARTAVEGRVRLTNQSYNFVATSTITQKGVASVEQVNTLTVDQRQVSTVYLDGLGREVQTVAWQGSPTRQDIVTPVSYDAFGRVGRTYLPYTGGADGYFKPDALGTPANYTSSKQYEFYQGNVASAYKHASDTAPYAVPVYEASPLGRVTEQGAPGQAWQPGTGHTVKVLQRSNAPGEARIFTHDPAANTWTTYGKSNPGGTAVVLDGVDDYVQVGDRSGLKLASTFTIEAWIYPTAATDGMIVNKEGEYEVARFPDGTIRWAFANTNPGWAWINTGVVAPLNTWSHIAVTYEAGIAKTYLNGALKHTYSGSGALGDVDPSYNDFRIGSRQNWGSYFKGSLDEVRVWGTVRNQQEIAGGMYGGASGTGLLGFWRLSEGSGSTTSDASGNGHAGTLMNGAKWELSSFYAAGTLHVTETRDEHDALTLEYRDRQGRVVAKKVQEASTAADTHVEAGFIITQYLYDDLGDLRLVIQPEGYRSKMPAPDALGNITLSKKFIGDWCFRYEYDDRSRMVEKQVPGAGPVEMVYSRRDELTMTRDANQKSRGVWSFTKYDALGRPLMTGEITEAKDRAAMQTAADGHVSQYESRTGPTGLGYTMDKAFPVVTEDNLLTVTYYDDYGYESLNGFAFKAEAGVAESEVNYRLLGQVTGSRTRRLDNRGWLTSVSYYDEKYQSLQTVAQNHLGGVDRVTTRYDFVGKALETLTTHQKGTAAYTATNQMDYDHAGRLLRTWQQMGGGDRVLLSRLSYNELGQLVDKKLHSTDVDLAEANRSYLQSVDMRYNIRGWLISINNGSITSDGGATNDDTNDLFGLELSYNTGLQTGTGMAQFNGNIAEMHWVSIGDGVQRGYGYTYDRASRLTGGYYRAREAGAWTGERGRYDVTGLSYDANGNINSMVRNGMLTGSPYDRSVASIFGVVDSLSYKYEGNRLATVNDTASATGPAGDFRDNGVKKAYEEGNASSWEYGYDANGNMTRDENKGIISVKYNHLNLPDTVFVKDKGYIAYAYTSSGAKIRKTVREGNKPAAITDYVGLFVHQADTVFAHTSEGRVLYEPGSGDGWRYEYHLKDHLGNLRVTFAEPATSKHLATMEDERSAEEQQFIGFENSRIGVVEGLDHTHKTAYPVGDQPQAVRLNSARYVTATPGIELKVMPGDRVQAKVHAKYVDLRKSTIDASVVVSALMGTAAGYTVTTDAGGVTKIWDSNNFNVATLGGSTAGAAPTATLSYYLFDEEMVLVDEGMVPVNSTASVTDATTLAGSHQELMLTVPTIERAGYLRVEVRHDAVEDVDIYFDDLEVEHGHGLLVQENHYDPWGLNLVGIERQNTPDHLFQYNGKERQAELGLGWIDYGARMYDAQLGRFHVQDRFAEKYLDFTPYQYGGNNPIRNIDINGDSIFVLNAPTGADPAGHMAMLIQNKDGKWSLWSKNGTNENGGVYGENEGAQRGVGEFSSPEDFLKSVLNPTVDEETGERYYSEGYLIPTTAEEDRAAEKGALKELNKDYNVLGSNCAETVQSALREAGKKDGSPSKGSALAVTVLGSIIAGPVGAAAASTVNNKTPRLIYERIKEQNKGRVIK